MELKNDLCSVRITSDTTYRLYSADNRQYDLELNPDHYRHDDDDYYSTFSIHIDSNGKEMDIALIGDYLSEDDDCAILEGKVLTVMQNKMISQICVDDGTLLRHKEFECSDCSFGLYRVEKGYIVHGETEIIMLDENFDRMWSFCGRDIFVSQTGEQTFSLGEDSVTVYDWDNRYYELDFSGNLISEGIKK